MTREELDELRRRRLAELRENLASGVWAVSGGDGTDDSDEEEDEEEDEEQDLDEDEDEEDDDDKEKSKGKKGANDSTKTKGRTGSAFKAPKDQDELDRIVERRLARERAKISADAATKTRQEVEEERLAEREKRKGNYDPILKKRDDKIVKLTEDTKELEVYREMFKDTLAKESKGLPKAVLEKLMPKSLSPVEQLQWVRDYREQAGLDDDDDEEGDEEEEDDDETEDDVDAKAARKRKLAAAKKDKAAQSTRESRRGTAKRPNAKTGVPKPEDLVKQQREKRGISSF